MEKEFLQEYVERAKELEVAIFTQQKFSDEYLTLSASQMPKRPMWTEPKCPYRKPISPEKPDDASQFGMVMGIILVVCGIAFLLMCLIMNLAIFSFPFVLGAGCLIFGVKLVVGSYQSIAANKAYQQRLEAFSKQIERFKANEKEWKETVYEPARKKFTDSTDQYNLDMEEYHAKQNEMIASNEAALKSLTDALEKHYEANIIFPKYRNLVAISAISEYLMSGRCSQLEGAEGAYNLYEMELRQNIVIGQLSKIVDNLEQIKSNQYTLYQELQHANHTVNELLDEVKEMKTDLKLTAYYAGVTALAETSPKITVGHIY